MKLEIVWSETAIHYSDKEIVDLEQSLPRTIQEAIEDKGADWFVVYICQELVLQMIRTLIHEQKLVVDEVTLTNSTTGEMTVINHKTGQVENWPQSQYLDVHISYLERLLTPFKPGGEKGVSTPSSWCNNYYSQKKVNHN